MMLNKTDKELIYKLVQHINDTAVEGIRIMEVCGTHTHQIAKLGIRKLLSPKIRLLSGPGCPVCVTESGYIDAAIKVLERSEIILATFGDMMRVRGKLGSLLEQKAAGKNVVVVYSPEDVLTLALNNRDKNIVFAAVGFETTAPLFAVMIKAARMQDVPNLYLFTALKRMEPVIRYVLEAPKVGIEGMLCPGHVASVTGIGPFKPVTEEYSLPAVVCGFEGLDILAGIGILINQITGKEPLKFMNLYKSCVSENGNLTAKNIMIEVFQVSDAVWRGIGLVKDSSLIINKDYENFDAAKKYNIKIDQSDISEECECSEIIIGLKTPDMCTEFGVICTPENPRGPCMVSSEGACAAYYRYGRFFV